MAKSYWRQTAAAAIQRGIDENPHIANKAELKAHISANYYPFGERAHHPYKIWLDELKKAFSDKTPPPPPQNVRDFWTR